MSPSDNSFFSGPVGMCVSAKAVYGWFTEGNARTTDQVSDSWMKVSAIQTEIGTLINKAVTDSGATWTGAAGDSMRSSTSPLSTWADMTSAGSQKTSTAMTEVSYAFRDAQNSVQPPVEVPDKPWYNDLSPWDTDYDDAVEKSQGVDEANMRVINTYAERTNAAISTMPTFEAPPDSTAEIGEEGTTPPPKHIEYPFEPVDKNGSGPGKNGTGGGDDSTIESEVREYTPPGTGDNGGGDDNGGDDGTTRPSDTDGTTRPSDVNDPNRPPIGTPGRPVVGTPGGVGDPSGVLPFGPNDPRNPANKVGGPAGLGGGRGAGGGGAGGAGGGRGGGLGGGGLGGGAGAGAGAGGRGGFGPGAGAAAAAGQFGGASGTAAGEGGRAGAGGFGPGGVGAGGRGAAGGAGAMGAAGHGAKGEGGDDLEHSSKYLQPSDEYFGDGTMVAPPVIGG